MLCRNSWYNRKLCLNSWIFFVALFFLILVNRRPELTRTEFSTNEQDLSSSPPNGEECADYSRGQIECQFHPMFPPNSKQQKRRVDTSSNADEMVILILVKEKDEVNLERSITHISKLAKDIPIVISLPETKSHLKYDLISLPVHIITYSLFQTVPLRSYAQNILSGYQTLLGLGNTIQKCPAHEVNRGINVLNISTEGTKNIVYEFTMNDENKQKEIVFGESVFHPYSEKILSSEESKLNAEEYKDSCKEIEFVKHSLKGLEDKFPHYTHVIILDIQKNFSADLISFFQSLKVIFDIDPSVYCVSAHNPLDWANANSPENELNRVDHFVYGGATLIAKKLSKEIIQHYKEHLEWDVNSTREKKKQNPLEKISEWLSWWSHRKLRSCIVPAKPRVCEDAKRCSNATNVLFDLQRVSRHDYFRTIFENSLAAQNLDFVDLPCKNNRLPPLETAKNKTGYSLFLKMISLDDDATLHYIFNCFGIEHNLFQGNFENLYKIYWNEKRIYIIGVPFSRFGPSIPRAAKIFVLDFELSDFDPLITVQRAKDYHSREFNVTTVPFVLEDEESRKNGSIATHN